MNWHININIYKKSMQTFYTSKYKYEYKSTPKNKYKISFSKYFNNKTVNILIKIYWIYLKSRKMFKRLSIEN